MRNLLCHPSSNLDLVSRFAAAIRSVDPTLAPPSIGLRRSARPVADLRIYFEKNLTAERQRHVTLKLNDDPAVASLQWKERTLSIRLDNDYIRLLGHRITERQLNEVTPTDLLSGQVYAVQFIDPNACKAFHLGHLYDAVLGHGMASMLTMAGAQVVRYSFVCDISRNVCEAMAGYHLFHTGQNPVADGIKTDDFVGRCYAEYVQDYYRHNGRSGQSAGPIGRENSVALDLADEFLQRWHLNDPETRLLWNKIRGWVMAGQEQTLRRIGIWIDRNLWGSEVLAGVDQIVQKGLRSGVFEVGENNAIVHRSGRKEYPTIVVVRGDGFSTEYGRQLALYAYLQDYIKGIDRYITIDGDEWSPVISLLQDVNWKLGHNIYEEKIHRIHHGMISHSGATVKSSEGTVMLADHLLDHLVNSRATQDLMKRYGNCSVEQISRIVVIGYFLSRKLPRTINFSYHDFFRRTSNPGWVIAEAYCRIKADNRIQHSELQASDSNIYRYAVIQSLAFHQVLRESVESIDLSAVIRYLQHISEFVTNESEHHGFYYLLKSSLIAGLAAIGV